MPRTITAEREGIALDALLWRVHGVRGRGLLEDTYALNPGLAGLGMHLPIGATVIIPDLPEQASPSWTGKSPRRAGHVGGHEAVSDQR